MALDGFQNYDPWDLSRVPISADLLNRIISGDASQLRHVQRSIDFSNAIFRDDVDLSQVNFHRRLKFDGAIFHGSFVADGEFFDGASFERVEFKKGARFDVARFDSLTTFTGAHFGSSQHPSAATFTDVRFRHGGSFDQAHFFGPATFSKATFGLARFEDVDFDGFAMFTGADFLGGAVFANSRFSEAMFHRATFGSEAAANFARTSFSGDQIFFSEVTFAASANFSEASFAGSVSFNATTFHAAFVGPMVCKETLSLVDTRFEDPIQFDVASTIIDARRTRFAARSALRLRYAALDLSDALLKQPLAVLAHPEAFTVDVGKVSEALLADESPDVQVVSISGVDAAQLSLTDIDLSKCRFFGAHHLDQVRLHGDCRFAYPPATHMRYLPRVRRWTKRQVVSEEHQWRAKDMRSDELRAGWLPGAGPVSSNAPAALAGIYRDLRKAFEDVKNEPGAADFYYGEMEARRNNRDTPPAERRLLHLYWAASGYGLRASRALAALAAAMLLTCLLMMTLGLPNAVPEPQVAGVAAAPGHHLSLVVDTPGAKLSLPFAQRWTWARAENAGLVVVNSVIFRSSGQSLTFWGTVIEMVSRFAEPALLALAALAIRARIKR